MARLLTDITDQILVTKAADPNLDGLSNTSQTSIWRLWAFVTAACLFIHESLWDLHIEEVQAIAARAVPGTLPWLRAIALNFQYSTTQNYFLTFQPDHTIVYYIVAPADSADRIVKYAAAVESANGLVLIKVATDSGGSPAPLSAPQLASFSAYMLAIKFAGTRLQVISLVSDKVRVTATIYYNPIANLTVLQPQVEAAIKKYLAELPFNGLIYQEKIQDAAQSVPGVVSVKMLSVYTDPGNQLLDRVYQTLSGYAEIDPANPLADTLTFVPSTI